MTQAIKLAGMHEANMRNPVAKNAKVNRSAVMADRKKAVKRGYRKHK